MVPLIINPIYTQHLPYECFMMFHGSFAQEESILDAFVRTSQSIYQTEGVAGFFQGGAARAVQIGMESCVFFTILEALKDGAKLILDF